MDTATATSPEFLVEDRGPIVIATASLMIIFCTSFVALRYYSRYLANTAFNVEDAIIPFAWLAEVGLCIVGIVMVGKGGTGRHIADILSTDLPKIPEHFKGVVIQEALHPAAVAFPKLSVVLLYLHILTNKYERFAAKMLIFLIFATWLSFTVATMFQCVPFSFNWDKTIPAGTCFNVQLFTTSSSIPNIATGLAVLILPLRTVWCLKISNGRRIGLLLIFLTGSVGIIASIIRTIVFAKTSAEAGMLSDVTWHHVCLINWTMVEPGMYLLSACALSFKSLLRSFARARHLQAFSTHTTSTGGKTRSLAKKKCTSTQPHAEAFELDHMRDESKSGKSCRLCDDSGDTFGGSRGDGKSEVVVAKSVDIGPEAITKETG